MSRTPVLFLGHGSPMNAIEDNAWSRGWRAAGERLPRPVRLDPERGLDHGEELAA